MPRKKTEQHDLGGDPVPKVKVSVGKPTAPYKFFTDTTFVRTNNRGLNHLLEENDEALMTQFVREHIRVNPGCVLEPGQWDDEVAEIVAKIRAKDYAIINPVA